MKEGEHLHGRSPWVRIREGGNHLSEHSREQEPTFRNTVGPQYEGWSVLEFYTRRYRHSSPARWEEWIRAGRVTRNGAFVRENDVLRTADVLIFRRPEREEPLVPRNYLVVYEDRHVLVADKPAGLPVAPGGVFFHHTLLHFLRAERPAEILHPAHRLDRETSGLLVFTKSVQAARILAVAFRERTVMKEYEALLCGMLDREVMATARVGRLDDALRRFCYGVTASGKEAVTTFTPLAGCPGKALTHVRAVPLTGRIHQVRIHAAHIGHPVLGDVLYGEKQPEGAHPAPRLALHSTRIVFPHPQGEKEFRSSPPEWSREVFRRPGEQERKSSGRNLP